MIRTLLQLDGSITKFNIYVLLQANTKGKRKAGKILPAHRYTHVAMGTALARKSPSINQLMVPEKCLEIKANRHTV